jgi:hypothetical protein
VARGHTGGEDLACPSRSQYSAEPRWLRVPAVFGGREPSKFVLAWALDI